VEIDCCPRGVWLDRGELEKIIERLTGAPWARDSAVFPDQPKDRREADGQKRKRRSFLSEMFEFGE
jgi:Zn-finger nucleic acid-binding protein